MLPQKVVEKFKAEVLKGFVDTKHLNEFNNDLFLCSCNEHYIDSSYFFDDSADFVHYTSAESALKIVESNSIRLYSLEGQNDISEFAYAAEHLNIEDSEISEIKRLMFILCLSLKESLNKITMFREYGDRTKGVAIILKIKNDIDWSSFHLSKVFYGGDDKLKLYTYRKAIFERENNVRINLKLNRFISFYKSPAYSDEREVRLLYYCTQEGFGKRNLQRIQQCATGKKYVPIPFYNEKDKLSPVMKRSYDRGIIPRVEIKGIILGPNFDRPDLIERIKRLNTLIEISESPLKGIYKE